MVKTKYSRISKLLSSNWANSSARTLTKATLNKTKEDQQNSLPQQSITMITTMSIRNSHFVKMCLNQIVQMNISTISFALLLIEGLLNFCNYCVRTIIRRGKISLEFNLENQDNTISLISRQKNYEICSKFSVIKSNKSHYFY